MRKGYLAFDKVRDTLKYHTAFRVLIPRYFVDFNQFVRCQDIPDSYFGQVIPGKSWYISHRWATPTHPDPNRTQFEILRQFVHRHQADGIWYDYSCMPQEPYSSSDQMLFTDSLKHMNSLIVTTNFLSVETDDYLSRAWCYYERIISELLCCSTRARIALKGAPKFEDKMVNDFVVEGKIPELKVEKSSDLPLINDLLVTGSDMFKMLAVSTTFSLLNSFGFQFGIGTAARLSQIIDFGKFWMIWQILAGSSEGSGIRMLQLLNVDRLRIVLTQRHEKFDTHAQFFSELQDQMVKPLDMRIIEQENLSRLSELLSEVSKSGPVPEAYTKLALIQLVYWMAGCDSVSERSEMKNTEKQKNPPKPRALIPEEALVIFALDTEAPEVDDSWFEDAFHGLVARSSLKGIEFGSWKVIRIPDMRIEEPNASGGGLGLPNSLIKELKIWNSRQHKPDLLRIVGIRKFDDFKGFAFIIHVPEG